MHMTCLLVCLQFTGAAVRGWCNQLFCRWRSARVLSYIVHAFTFWSTLGLASLGPRVLRESQQLLPLRTLLLATHLSEDHVQRACLLAMLWQ